MKKSTIAESTRRHFFSQCGVGLGQIALGGLLSGGQMFGAEAAPSNPMAPKAPHFPAKAKNVIFLFMAGGPSQLEMFDYKPELEKRNGQNPPAAYLEGKRFAFMDSFTKDVPKLLGPRRTFQRYGKSGKWVSDTMPHVGGVVDDIAFVSGIKTENFNHAPAKIMVNTGSPRFGRPSMGAWVTYGIGSESENLPGFVVLQSGPRGPRGGALNWGAGFLPTSYQGVPFQSGGDPILNLSNPAGFDRERQGKALDTLRALNLKRLAETGDPEISTRIASYEMAYRMQSSAPELIDLGAEDQKTLDLYGAEPGAKSYANNCLLARRLVERGARFVQLYHTDWDHHGGPHNLGKPFDDRCREIDQATAALITDLKQRGMLEDTLVVWGGEFGRTPMGEERESVGRNHHIDAFTMFFAGAGVKPGQTVGETDDFGFSPVDTHIDVHDVQATILHLLGLDHERLTFKFQGRDFRLTDVGGKLIEPLLS
jgi:hypothetical protein